MRFSSFHSKTKTTWLNVYLCRRSVSYGTRRCDPPTSYLSPPRLLSFQTRSSSLSPSSSVSPLFSVSQPGNGKEGQDASWMVQEDVNTLQEEVGRLQERVCMLCDCPYTIWRVHVGLPTHIARTAVCRTFAAPDRAASIASHLSKHLDFDFDRVDAESWERERRRRSRLGSTLLHLTEKGVLREGLPFTVCGAREGKEERIINEGGEKAEEKRETTVVSEGFMRYVLVGDGYAREEVINRVARLMPYANAMELEAIEIYILSPLHLARLYEDVQMERTVAARWKDAKKELKEEADTPNNIASREELKNLKASRRLFLDGKALVMLSCIGELFQFKRRDRPHSVANKEAAETLVLHVLVSHAIENLISELVHAVLQRIVHEGTPIWRQFQANTASNAFKRNLFTSNPLSATPKRKLETASPDLSHPLSKHYISSDIYAEQLMGFFVVRDVCENIDTVSMQKKEENNEKNQCQIQPKYMLPKYQLSWIPLLRSSVYDNMMLDSPKDNLKNFHSISKGPTNNKK
ncbi:unnamed protein product [Phytomonas sp. Hart1]|nr:unnamed protein product [Phytomonas sp. Hart1]|eukprot:CCW71482.1 unnamed protein product [Phytomonas sp. isolate Hart1]